MAVVARNRRSQEDIYKSLGLHYPGPSGNQMIDDTPGYVGARNPTPSASEIQGMPKNPISFNGPPAAATEGIVGAKPAGEANYTAPSMISSSSYTTKSGISQPQRREFVRPEFTPGGDTDEYYDLMQETEGARPDPFKSRYEGAIQSILDGIMNRKSFDINKDQNYQALYNLYAQQYQAQADRAMRDTMGAMQAATGGYGSTAATAAAGQAYDRAMEGLNARNMELMNLAYQMYGDETADRYNQLGAVTGLDNTDYARYRDTVADWQADRAYYANQYQNFFGNDLGQYQFNTNLDWQANQAANQWDWQEYQDAAERSYRAERDELEDYDAAFDKAYKLASAGQGIPAAYANKLEPETVQMLQALAAEAQAEKTARGSGGGGGRGGRGGSGGSSRDLSYTQDEFNAQYNDLLKSNGKATADEFAEWLKQNGTFIPTTYGNASDVKASEYAAGGIRGKSYTKPGGKNGDYTVSHRAGDEMQSQGLYERIKEIQRRNGTRR